MKVFWLALSLAGAALAGAPVPPKPPQAQQLTGRAYDRQFAGEMQVYLKFSLAQAQTALGLSKNPAAYTVIREVKYSLEHDINTLQAFQRREGYSLGAYGIACGVGLEKSNAEQWFIKNQAKIDHNLAMYAGGVFKHSHNPQLKAFAHDFVTRRNAESRQLTALLDNLK